MAGGLEGPGQRYEWFNIDRHACKAALQGQYLDPNPKPRVCTHLGPLLEGHRARDGAIAKALLLKLHFEPLNGAGKLAENQRLG